MSTIIIKTKCILGIENISFLIPVMWAHGGSKHIILKCFFEFFYLKTKMTQSLTRCADIVLKIYLAMNLFAFYRYSSSVLGMQNLYNLILYRITFYVNMIKILFQILHDFLYLIWRNHFYSRYHH